MKNKWIYLLAVVFGLLTSYLIYDFLVKVENKMVNENTEEVVIVSCDVTSSTLLDSKMVSIKELPVDVIHPQALRKTEDAIGTISIVPLVEGEQLLKSKIVTKDDVKNGLAYLVPPGKRAMSIPVDEVSGVAGLLKPGDRVDVMAVASIPDSSGENESLYSFVVLQDVGILAVGGNLEIGKNQDKNKQVGKSTLTLAVTVEEARVLLLANQKGVIRIILRSPIDTDTVQAMPFQTRDFFK
ncbi:MAG: Flp pilus assembly protein CpaB [Clostridia bacterium]|nr:Flp pilus assembly protein CpaB [Clostridia bacterium]MDD4048810.1 Flp pilus assembly protein CpaB [Clostridia bacterium]